MECLEYLRNFSKENKEGRESQVYFFQILGFFFQNSWLSSTTLTARKLAALLIDFMLVDYKNIQIYINEIVKCLINCENNEESCNYFEYIISEMKRVLKFQNNVLFSLREQEGLDPYLMILIEKVQNGIPKECESALTFYELILNQSIKDAISKNLKKIIKSFKIALDSRKEIHIKSSILEILYKLERMEKIGLENFAQKLQTIYFKLLREGILINEITRNLLKLLNNRERKESVLKEILETLKKVNSEITLDAYIIFTYSFLKELEKEEKLLLEKFKKEIFSIFFDDHNASRYSEESTQKLTFGLIFGFLFNHLENNEKIAIIKSRCDILSLIEIEISKLKICSIISSNQSFTLLHKMIFDLLGILAWNEESNFFQKYSCNQKQILD
jgi:hypothetical protein